jgi:hypothetical protein
LISPNGRYIFFVTETQSEHGADYGNVQTGHVVEIVKPKNKFLLREIKEYKDFPKKMLFHNMDIYNLNNSCRNQESGFFISDNAKIYWTHRASNLDESCKLVYEGIDVTDNI